MDVRNSLPVVDQEMRRQEGGARARRGFAEDGTSWARASAASMRAIEEKRHVLDRMMHGAREMPLALLALAWASNGGYYLGCQQGTSPPLSLIQRCQSTSPTNSSRYVDQAMG